MRGGPPIFEEPPKIFLMEYGRKKLSSGSKAGNDIACQLPVMP